MSRSDLALSVRGLSKSYTIAHQATQTESTLAETMLRRIQRPFASSTKETFWALKDVSFDVKKGDVVGIIGRNGAGKSTLLKLLSRITEPTDGRIDLYGRVGSLLEVGTGFHPELTGRENIFLNGAILGMSRTEIRRQFDAIVDFAGVETFLDTPVKRYSSGMYVRLAFAVAAHLRSEILILDEVLAVGDAEFQKKCVGKMKDVAHDGRTVLFVSHNMHSVRVLCKVAMFLEAGRLKNVDHADNAIADYLRAFTHAKATALDADRRGGTGELRVVDIHPEKLVFSCHEEKVIEFEIERRRPFSTKYFVACQIVNELGSVLVHCDSRMADHWIEPSPNFRGRFSFRTPWLKPGDYRVEFYVCCNGVIDQLEDACRFTVSTLLPYDVPANDEATHGGVVFADFRYDRG